MEEKEKITERWKRMLIDLFVIQHDKISDYNSLENDIIIGKCEYEDKGLIPTLLH